MKVSDSSRQFVKDGLIGVALALLVFLILTSTIWNRWTLMVDESFDYFRVMFFVSKTYNGDYMLGPMLLVILTAFIGVGLVGRFLETNPSEKNWIMLAVKTLSIPLRVGLGLSVVYGIFLGSITYIVYFAIAGALALVPALLLDILGGVIFKPQKRLYKIIIGAISSALISYSIGFIILISIVTPRD